MVPATPRGFRDVLPSEAAWRESIQSQVQALFDEWGYDPVETPTLESVAALSGGHALSTTPFRFFDVDGNQLALRPDVTLPIARMAATRLKDVPRPLRLRYTAPVFREEESLRGEAREFTQMGVESIGMAGPEADAEVIALFVEGLYATGLTRFTVDFATVSVLADLVASANDDPDWQSQVLDAYHVSNWVLLGKLASKQGVRPAFGRAIAQLPRISGGREAIDECRQLVAPLGCDSGLDDLEKTYDLLDERGVAGFVRVDFSIMNSLDYYTGLVMQAFAPGCAHALGSGGRYDKTLASFGKDEPAAGFAFGLESTTAALSAVGARPESVRPVPAGEKRPARAPRAIPRIEPGQTPEPSAPRRRLRIAVPKGALNPGCLDLLEKAGLDLAQLRDPGRQMMFESEGGAMDVEYIIVRPTDAPVFVANGGADVGIAGEDSIVEADLDVVELADLRFGGCRFVVAEPEGATAQVEENYRRRGSIKVATKYPNITRAYYDRIGVQADIIKLHGNIELAPTTGMADRIVDITATGTSLRENHLVVVDDVMPSTARFIASPAAARIDPRVRTLAAAFEAAVKEGE